MPPFEAGLEHHRAGRLSEADAIYCALIAVDPDHIDALHFAGVIAYQRGQHAQAAALIEAALERNPANAPAQNNLGNALAAQGLMERAVACYREAVRLSIDTSSG